MGTMVGMRSELGTLEIGLKDLRRSRLMGIQEFKDMYGAIERHHRDLRLAHLTGKEKDLMTQAQRDTKFFHVLVKMLCEVKQLRTGKQKESLRKVYTWYMANRHTLSSRPHFGKSYQLKEASDFRQKITNSPRKNTDKKDLEEKVDEPVSMARLSSAEGLRRFFKSATPSSSKMGRDSPIKGAPIIFDLPSNKDYVNEYLTSRFLDIDNFASQIPPYQTETSTSRLFSGVQVQDAGHTKSDELNVLSPTLMEDGPDAELENLLDGDLFPDADVKFDDEDPTANHSSANVDDMSNVSPRYIESLINESHKDPGESGSINTEDLPSTEDMEFPENKRKLSRGKTASASLRTAMTDQSSNVSIVLPKKMIHPIASLVNPHAQLAAMEAKRAEEEYLAARENMTPSVRVTSSKSKPTDSAAPVFKPTTGQASSRLDNLHTWKNFSKDFSYGQDILGKLHFVGRSGTAVDVRYTAHDNAEMPESHTSNVIAFYAAQNNDDGPVKVLGPVQVDSQASLTQQSLEDFYKLTDNYYPTKLPKYRPHSSKAKPSSSPSKEPVDKQRKVENKPPVPKLQLLGKNLLPHENKENKAEKNDPDTSRSDVKLDDVVNMIDDVTDDMTYFKERLAPRPHPGFRHPASSGVSMLPLSRPSTANSASRTRPSTAPQRPSTATGIRTTSPVQRSNTPAEGEAAATSRPAMPNPFAGRDILIPAPDTPNNLTTKPTPTAQVNPVVQAIDWRGKITPDSVRYKWQATKFGGHTYVKKLMSGKRPVGATHGGSRPKTAPASTRERWKTEKPCDNNSRITSQAATNNMTQVDQDAVDSMLIINHLVGSSDSKLGSLNSLLMDENFLRSLSAKHPSTTSTVTNTPIPMEYVSIISRPRSVVDSRAQSRQTRQSDRPESQPYEQIDGQEPLGGSTESTPRQEGQLTVPQLITDQISLHIPATGPGSKVTAESSERPAEDVAQDKNTQTVTFLEPKKDSENVDEEERSEEGEESGAVSQVVLKSERDIKVIHEERSDAGTATPTSSTPGTVFHRPVEYHTEDLHDGEVHIEVTGIPSGGRAPTPPASREGPIQELSKSEEWNFSPDINIRSASAGDLIESQRRKVRINSSCLKSDHWTKYITAVKPETYCFDCIPDTMSAKVGRTAGRMPTRTQSASSQVLRMSRKQNEYYKMNPPLRTPPSIPSTQHSQYLRESPRYGQTFNSELEHHARKIKSPRRFMEEVVDLRKDVRSAPAGMYMQSDSLSASLTVCRLDGPSRESTVPEIVLDAAGRMPQSILREPAQEELGLPRETTEEGLKRVGFKMEYDDLNNSEKTGLPATYTSSRSQSNVSIAHVGRPIPQYQHIGDPAEVAAAVERQREAKAAVDIQRIFRGYVARVQYKMLLKEEREKLEDERMAYNESQRKYKEHLNSKAEIYNRPNKSTEMVEWSSKVKKIQDDKAEQRQKKMEALADQNTKNYQSASNKISVIGPHVNIYQIYHPKQVGPTKRELHFSATHIQKYIRGFLVRKRFEKLRRKAKLYGTTWKRLVKDYKGTLARCQMRHGVDRPKTPFTIQDMNDYMDARRRYESIFEKKAFGGELEVADMEAFFRECDLYPSMTEIEHGLDVILPGHMNKKHGLKKNEMLELVFYIYVPKATSLTNTRQSTWINPIIDGVEAKKLLGFPDERGNIIRSDLVEPAPLDKCAKIVIDSKRMRRQKEEKERQEREEAKRLELVKKVGKRASDDSDSVDSNS